MEMAFVEQDDVFNAINQFYILYLQPFLILMLQSTFSKNYICDAMRKYGTDKPDLRNPINISNLTEEFNDDKVEFSAFKKIIKRG